MNWRVRWHRHNIAGRTIAWFWGNHSSPNASYGWHWFSRDDRVRPTNWRASFGPLYISIWGRRRASSG